MELPVDMLGKLREAAKPFEDAKIENRFDCYWCGGAFDWDRWEVLPGGRHMDCPECETRSKIRDAAYLAHKNAYIESRTA